jgi:ferredoxin
LKKLPLRHYNGEDLEETNMAKAKVDKDLCIGCGLCCGAHADLFTFADDGKAECIGDGAEEDVADAIASCPVQAISED